MRHGSNSARDDDGLDDELGENLAAVNDRLDALTHQIERISQGNTPVRDNQRREDPPRQQFSETLDKLDRRLEQIIADGRQNLTADPDDQARAAPISTSSSPSPQPAANSPQPARGPDHWAAEILARRRLLNAESGTAHHATPPSAPPAPPVPSRQPAATPAAIAPPAQDLTGLESQLRAITQQIASLHQPYEQAFDTLRSDLAEVGKTLTEAVPRRAIEALEAEVRRLADRIDRSRANGVDPASLASLERGLVEVRDVLHNLAPAENLVEWEAAVQVLSRKIDEIGAVHHDPSNLHHFEQAIAQMREVVSDVASDGALTKLSAEVHTLSSRFEQLAADSNHDGLHQLEHRIASLMDDSRRGPSTLETAIQILTDRLDRMPSNQGDPLAFDKIEATIRTLSDRIEGIQPIQTDHLALDSLQTAIHTLSERLDRVQLSEDDHHALDSLQASIQSLGDRLDRVQPSPDDHFANDRLESTIRALTDRLDQMPGQEEHLAALESLQTVVRTLGDRFDHIPLSQGDQLALGSLEDRIVKLAEKLDLSDARLRNLDNIERGISDLLVLLDEMRNAPSQPDPTYSESPRHDPHGAVPPNSLNQPAASASPASVLPSVYEPWRDIDPMPSAQRAEPRRPIDPDLPPDLPLEPGTGIPRLKPGSPAARIAASEAALGNAMPAAASLGKSETITAARNAARSAYSAVTRDEPKAKRSWLKLFNSLTTKMVAAPTSEPPLKATLAATAAPVPLERPNAAKPVRQKIFGHAKTVLIAASVVIIVLGGLQAALDFFMPANPPQVTKPDLSSAPAVPASPPTNPVAAPAAPPAPAPDTPGPTGAIMPSLLDPATLLQSVPPPPPPSDITGSITPRVPVVVSEPLTLEQAIAALPPSIEPALRVAATDNPAAAYEISTRYADGRGFPRSATAAVFWLEQAAKAGFAPAQYRLGSLNEKGDGTKKDLANALRLYLAAANQGHAKAMHNLAVLYAEGIDGKPDYKAAAEWFRKAANYGVSDSQYNLAILYARGIGVEQNLAESYRWFALAAARGDQDAAKKRDEVVKRLDKQSLVAAKLAVQTFTPEPEPEAAVSLGVPPSGWTTVAVDPPKSEPHTPSPAVR